METTSIMTVQITVIAEDKDGAMVLPFGAANKKELAAEIKKLLDCDDVSVLAVQQFGFNKEEGADE